MLAFIPFAVLILLLVCCISVFGNATLDGASQVSLIIASGVSVLVGLCGRRLSWDNLDKEMTAAMLRNYALNVPETYQPEVVKTVKEKFGGDYRRYVDWLYKKSKVLKKGQKFYFNNTKKYLKDPGVALGIDLMSIYAVIGVGNFQTTTQQIEEQEPLWSVMQL